MVVHHLGGWIPGRALFTNNVPSNPGQKVRDCGGSLSHLLTLFEDPERWSGCTLPPVQKNQLLIHFPAHRPGTSSRGLEMLWADLMKSAREPRLNTCIQARVTSFYRWTTHITGMSLDGLGDD